VDPSVYLARLVWHAACNSSLRPIKGDTRERETVTTTPSTSSEYCGTPTEVLESALSYTPPRSRRTAGQLAEPGCLRRPGGWAGTHCGAHAPQDILDLAEYIAHRDGLTPCVLTPELQRTAAATHGVGGASLRRDVSSVLRRAGVPTRWIVFTESCSVVFSRPFADRRVAEYAALARHTVADVRRFAALLGILGPAA